MAEEQKQATAAQAPAAAGKGLEKVQHGVEQLAEFGGFELAEGAIEGVQNLNPDRKARKKIFLSEKSKAEERDELRRSLNLWIEVLSSADNVVDMVAHCEEGAAQADSTLKGNLKKALEQTRELETSYRSMASFFKNTDMEKVDRLTILNADAEQLRDLDNTRFFDAVRDRMVQNYDRLDLRNNYSLMILPGYLGSGMVVDKWSKMAHENKVMLVTDFMHLDNPEDVLELFQAEDLTSGDIHKSNVMMTCNYLVGRGRNEYADEEEPVYIPPSGSLGGKIYKTLMSQVAAGKKFGALSEVDGVKFDLKKSEIANMEKLGLVPMVNEYNKVMAFSAKTLFNGDNLGLQTYSVVRVFDYVTKVMMDFLNRRAFENFNANTRKDLMGQIVRFLDGITGPNKLIENFSIKRFEQDPNQKDRVYLDIHMKPYFPAKNFMIKMDGQRGDDGNEWNADYEQS